MLLHAVFLWLPGISLPRIHAHSSVLTVRMEPSPGRLATAGGAPARAAPVAPPKPAAPKPRKPRPATAPSAMAQISVVQDIASSVAAAPAPAVSAVPLTAPVAAEQAAAAPDIDPNRSKGGISPLPLHVQLRFAVYLGGSGFSIGDIFQELDIKEGRYTLQAELDKAGLASWFNKTQLTQISRGALLANGDLSPESFMEESTDDRGEHHRYEAAFDWNAKQLRFADGTGSQMPAGTQDTLSLLYQLSQYQLHTEKLRLVITDGQQLKNIVVEVGMLEEIAAPMGSLQALHINQLHAPGEPWFDVWLASDYHLLPVRFLKTGADGKISEEWIIKEIRVSDDQQVK
ncbi:MAG TPA: DUF3108 domain-containing protein [Gallionellaceae bacterium]